MNDDLKTQRDFLMVKLNSDMNPAATDLFVPLIVKELREIHALQQQHQNSGNYRTDPKGTSMSTKS